ncbi:MAG: VTT domain-containing protein [Candidatus Woesearchaeota archaeon]|nr:MAG: VTT domain-containing protein [Candidatus Woesearchaeota archaeon]
MNEFLTFLVENYLLYVIFLLPFLTQIGVPLGLTFFLVLQGMLLESYSSLFSLAFVLAICLTLADSLAFAFARYYRDAVLRRLQKERYKKLFEQTTDKLERHYYLTIFLSRTLILGIAPILNYVLGLKDLSYRKFFFGLVWAEFIYLSIFLFIGMYFKDSAETIFSMIQDGISIIVGLIVLVFLVRSFFKRRRRKEVKGR